MRKYITSVLVVSGLALCSVTGLLAQKQPSLYDSLGGKKVITAVVDEFVARVAADKRINGFFAQTASDSKRLASFKAKLVDQICEANCGPSMYKGKDKKTEHAGKGVSNVD